MGEEKDETVSQKFLLIFHCDGIRVTKLHTGKATMTFVNVCWRSFGVFQFVYIAWAVVYTLSTAITFLLVNCYVPHGVVSRLLWVSILSVIQSI